MSSTAKNARSAGFLYLLLTLVAPFRLLYIPGTLFVRGDAAATAANIAANETLFRFGIVSELACGVILIFLVLALYRLFRDVDRNRAVLMLIVGGLIPATIDFLVVLNDCAALLLVRGDDIFHVFDQPHRDALTMLFIRMHHQQILAAEILWGIWLFPLGMLIIRSGFIPRILGYLLILNGVTYLLLSLTGLLLPQYEAVLADYTMPALFGEVLTMLWLLIRGARGVTVENPAR
jgi:hypothetical protein